MNSRFLTLFLLISLTIVSGIGDSQGFVHAAKVWDGSRLNWAEAGKSALGYTFGVVIYWASIRFFNLLGMNAPEIQTIAWFVVTIAGVALFNGEFLKWDTVDRALGLAAVLAVGILMFRRGG